MHQLAVESMADMTVFVDEGTVLIAYLLFVYSEGAYSQLDLERFAALVPKPGKSLGQDVTSFSSRTPWAIAGAG